VSSEYIIVTAAMLLILTLLIVIFNGVYAQQNLRSQYLQAHHAISVLSASATEVWAEGNGSSQQVLMDLPPSTLLDSSGFTSTLMYLNLSGFGHVSMATAFPINGTWPSQYGRTLMSIYNNGSAVYIRPAGRLQANLTGFYFNFTSGGWSQITLGLRNQANASYVVTHTLTCPGSATCTYAPTSPVTLAAQDTQSANLNITSSTPGLSTGYLTLDMVPAGGSGLPTEQYVLPITIRVD
jgi:hypothetical protein